MIDARTKISNAIIKMQYQFKYFSMLAMKMEIMENTQIPTMATDGRRLFYNTEFVDSLTLEEVTFVIMHEVIHCIYDHIGRAGGRHPMVWNMAIDYVTNGIIKDTIDDRILQMPKCRVTDAKTGKTTESESGLYDSKYTNWTSEKVYDELMKNMKNQSESYEGFDEHMEPSQDEEKDENKSKSKGEDEKPQDGEDEGKGGGQGGDGDQDGEGGGQGGSQGDGQDKNKKPTISKQGLEENMNRFKREMIQTAKTMRSSGCGDIPGDILRLIDELDKPQFSWQDILRATIESAYVYDRSFAKPSRRSLSMGGSTYLPGPMNENMINIAIAIDTSGSIGHDDIKMFLSEIQGIMSAFNSYKIHLWCFDAIVQEESYTCFTEIENEDMRDYKPMGGGGTDFGENWKFIEKEGIEVDRFIMLTDGYCGFENCEEDVVDTLWVINDPYSDNREFEPPFGETVYFDN